MASVPSFHECLTFCSLSRQLMRGSPKSSFESDDYLPGYFFSIHEGVLRILTCSTGSNCD